ncbi:MAG TPA: amidase [Roseobacter sp.]|nr:amidase [Roseobacter sp.]HEC71725.1 amidase [Roseobacter sp.]
MPVTRPNKRQLNELAETMGMNFSPEDLDFFHEELDATMAAYDAVDALPDYLPAVKYPRVTGYHPDAAENELNAWAWKVDVEGAADGPLKGKTVALKDNVCLAGVPMRNGSNLLEGYVPNIDATIVTRLLDAGATIKGKAVCEYFCLSGGSHTSQPGPVHNPIKKGYSAGGSSSGSAALVGSGEVDMAIGGDQGGSIRIPAAYSGLYGMKGTHGLVPYSGIMPIESTIDHTGPMTANVADNALMLEVLAGPDGLDPRQYNVKVAKYTDALDKDVKGLKIGILKEGFGHDSSEKDVDEKVRAAADLLRKNGATVEEVSVEMHKLGPAIWSPIALEGLQFQMMNGNGLGMNWKGLYTTSLLDHLAGWQNRADELSDTLKISMLVGEYGIRHHRGHFYAKAQNLARKLKEVYDAALENYDLLLMPTLPMKATKLPEAGGPRKDILSRAFEMLPNTAPFNVTGHPAMAIPCGMSGGLPVSMMLVGKFYDESTIYRAASAFEGFGDWKKM